MTEQKEFESLDELFRKTFDNLPDAPAPSGWDTPSEKVWDHVRANIAPPKTGWSTQSLTLIAAFAVTLTVGLYLLLNRPDQPESPVAAPTPAASVAEAPQQATETAETATVKEPGLAEMPAGSTAKTARKKTDGTSAAPESFKNNSRNKAAEQPQVDSSERTPATTPERKAPNTTLRLKKQLAKQAEKAWKENLDALPQRWPDGIDQ